jgi:hypothetical protein
VDGVFALLRSCLRADGQPAMGGAQFRYRRMERILYPSGEKALPVTEAQMRELVAGTFLAGWTAALPDVPLWLEGEVRPTSDRFARLSVVPSASAQLTVGRAGTRRIRRHGWAVVKLWGPSNAGVAGVAAMVDVVKTILEVVSLDSPNASDERLTTQAANTEPGGEDPRWLMMLVRIPFWYSETK